MGDKLHLFMKIFKNFASKYGNITGIKIKLCKKSCRTEKVGGAQNLICINFKCL